MTRNRFFSLILILVITFTLPMIGSYTTSTFKEPWYSQIILPSFNPPSWVFAPVWSTLYFLMSLAIWKIWIKSYDKKLFKIKINFTYKFLYIINNKLKKINIQNKHNNS